VDVTPLSSGGDHSPGFVRIYKRTQPTNSSAWEKDSPLGSWNKTVLPPLWVALRFVERQQKRGPSLDRRVDFTAAGEPENGKVLADSVEGTQTLVTGSTSYVVGTAPRELTARAQGILDEVGPALHENQYAPL